LLPYYSQVNAIIILISFDNQRVA